MSVRKYVRCNGYNVCFFVFFNLPEIYVGKVHHHLAPTTIIRAFHLINTNFPGGLERIIDVADWIKPVSVWCVVSGVLAPQVARGVWALFALIRG